MNQLGQKIRTIREQKGISLNAFARRLQVSPGYLSNLERGKTDTIELSLIPKLQSELNLTYADIFPLGQVQSETYNEFEYRAERACSLLKSLNINNPKLADFLLSVVEEGVELDEACNDLQEYH